MVDGNVGHLCCASLGGVIEIKVNHHRVERKLRRVVGGLDKHLGAVQGALLAAQGELHLGPGLCPAVGNVFPGQPIQLLTDTLEGGKRNISRADEMNKSKPPSLLPQPRRL